MRPKQSGGPTIGRPFRIRHPLTRYALPNSHQLRPTLVASLPGHATSLSSWWEPYNSQPERQLKETGTMRYLLAIAAIVAGTAAHAADKGQPATLEQIMSLPDKRTVSCYVETSVAGTFLKDDRKASAGIGGGCDVAVASLILGGGIRADFADWRDAGSIFARVGLALNAGSIIYGLAEWRMPDWKPQDIGQLAVGGGLEVKLEPINPNLWLFGEGTYAAETWGQTTADDVTGRIGVRWKY